MTNLPDRRRLITALVTGVVLVALTALNHNAKLTLRSLPTIDGYYRFLGLQERAEVIRDGFGVPRIYANNEHDLFFLQGYVTAQDRFAQMEELRDRFLIATTGELPSNIAPALNAYAAGVTKWIGQHSEAGALPRELMLSGVSPQPWTAADSLAIASILIGSPFGSICTVLGGDATARGAPLVGAELRAASEPGWYEIGIQSGSGGGLGLSLPGVPGVVSGHNGLVAWSLHPRSGADQLAVVADLVDVLRSRSVADVPAYSCAADTLGGVHTRLVFVGTNEKDVDVERLRIDLAAVGEQRFVRFSGEAPPSARIILDLGDLDASKAALSTGQSGHPASRHYMDQRQLWEAGQLHRLIWTREKIARVEGQLVLRPR